MGALGSSRALPSFQSTVFTGSAVLTAVVQYCNFCQLSSWMRSSLATVVGAGPLLLLLYVSLCPDRYVSPARHAGVPRRASPTLTLLLSPSHLSS